MVLPCEAIGAKTQPFTTRVSDDITDGYYLGKIAGIRMPNTEKSAVVVIASNCVDSSISKIKLQPAELSLSIFAEALHSDGQRKLLPATCLIVGKHRRRRFEKGIAT